MANAMKKTLVLGLGHTGCTVIETLTSLAGYSDLEYLAVDSDASELERLAQKNIRTLRILQDGGELFRPMAPANAKSLLEKKEEILGILKGYDVVICAAGLGGQAGSCVGKILEYADSLDIPTLLLAVMPFSFEDETRIQMAESALTQMEVYCRVVLLAPNDSALTPDVSGEGQGVDLVFDSHTRYLAMAAAALSVPFARKNLFNVSPSLFAGLARDATPRCQFLTAEAAPESASPADAILESIRNSSLFKEYTFDRAVALLRVNGKCRESELNKLFTGLKQECKGIAIEAAACVDDALPVSMRLTLLLHPVDFIDEPEVPDTKQQGNEQLSIEFPDEGLGIFSNDSANMWNGVNIDIPTYMRGNISIDKGT